MSLLRVWPRAVLVLALLSVGWAQPGRADEWTSVFDEEGLLLRSGELQIDVGGRLQLDVLDADSDLQHVGRRSGIRRAGVNVGVEWHRDYSLAASFAFESGGAALSGLSFNYDGLAPLRLKIGKLSGVVGMERRAGSGDLPLMERALSTALTSGSAWGASAGYAANGVSAEVAYFTERGEHDRARNGSPGRGWAVRAAYATPADLAVRVHVGASAELRTPDRDLFRARQRPEADLVDARLLDSSLLRDAQGRRTVGAEAAVQAGPVTLQAEYLTSSVQRRVQHDAEFTGGYVQVGWVLTGQQRRYRERAATLGGVQPAGTAGEVELVARYGRLDLESGRVTGGEGTVASAGINWFASRNVALSLMLGRADGQPNRVGVDERVKFVQARLQLKL